MCGCGARLRCGNLARGLRASWANFDRALPDFTRLRDTDFEKQDHETIAGTMKTLALTKIAVLMNSESCSRPASRFLRALKYLSLAALLFPALSLASAESSDPADPAHNTVPAGTPHVTAERNGVLETADGLTLHLTADIGSVRIVPLEAGAPPVVRYEVHLETDARDSAAKHLLDGFALKTKSTSSGVDIDGQLPPNKRGRGAGAQFWVHYEITVPAGYHVEVRTGAGDIETQEIGGSATLSTQGGNITAGRIGAKDTRKANDGHVEAKFETEGGHIQVQEVVGDLRAFTAGGHIVAGDVSGDASLRSGGGHIRVAKIAGRAELQTDGGNITVSHAGSFVNVRTGGGQIDFGEVRGSVHAQTAGGGIRIMYVSGPMEVVSSGGSICLTRVAGTVQAATTDGTITAWISPDTGGNSSGWGGSGSTAPLRLSGSSQLTSGNGDIMVFLPRNLAANIEAVVTSGDAHHIIADPAIHLAMQPGTASTSGAIRAVGELNGGGAPLRLKTAGGNIRLQFLDSQTAMREALVRDQQARLNQRLGNIAQVAFDGKFTCDVPDDCGPLTTAPPTLPQTPDASEAKPGWLDGWVAALEGALTGGIREDSSDFQKRLTYAPHPSYPSLAQGAGIQGVVKLQVRVTKDGRVEVIKLLEGEPVLADAAIASVKSWRAKPASVNGKPVEVTSELKFNFQLN
jgi:TonB family protein